jgi:hypothetical protein
MRFATLIASVLSWTLLVGCAPQSPPAAPGTLPAASATGASAIIPDGETWDAIFIQGSQLGFIHTTTRHVQHDGRPLIEIVAQQQLNVSRFGDQATPGVLLKSLETPEGALVSFEGQQQIGPTAQSVKGEVRGGELVMETTTVGRTETSRIPWKDEYGGFFAMEHSLLRQPMKAGEQRKAASLAPVFNQLVTYEFTAKDEEQVKLLDDTQTLRRIEVVTTFPNGNTIRSNVWATAKGEVLKTRTDAFGQETIRTTKARAQGGASSGAADLGLSTMVRLERPLTGAHRTRRIRYELTLSGDPGLPENDPAQVFRSGPLQQLKATGPNAAEMTVTSLRPGEANSQGPSQYPPGDADKQPNNLIQSDHPLVVQMAREAAGKETDPLKVALALERYVRTNVRVKNFTQALATAADVAQTREGDCTEHAVLLAALARANQIPARVAIGLVYVEHLQGFGYHMWNELYLNDAWIPFDGTLGQGGTGAAHLKLAHTHLAGGDSLSAFLPVAQVLGRLKIKILEVE